LSSMEGGEVVEARRSHSEMVRTVVDGTKERLRRIKGQVFHVIDNNQLLLLRIGRDGRILERRLPHLDLGSLAAVPKRLLEAGKEAGERAKGRARRKWRKVVTGDPNKRIRDHMREVPQVKLYDKISFTFGVLCICGTEWLALRHPEFFPLYYYVLMMALLVNRFITYAQENWHLFMLDFCYFVNLSVTLQTAFFPDHLLWYKANYMLAMGPLMTAIMVWKNSLVFHSLDKLTSMFLHAFPPLTVHLFRWGLIQNKHIKLEDTLWDAESFGAAVGVYLVWQIGYWVFTEVLLAPSLARDPTLITSIRYLASDKKNGFRNFVMSVMVKLGVHKRGDPLDPDGLKAKLVFGITQLIYTIITISPTLFFFSSYALSCGWMTLAYSWGTWNGACYYIEVFAERYRMKFIIKEEVGVTACATDDSEMDVEDEDEEEDDFQNAEEELELDQSSELYKTIVAAIIKEEEDGDSDEEDGDLEEDELEEKTPSRDAGVKTDSQASGRVIKRASGTGARMADDK